MEQQKPISDNKWPMTEFVLDAFFEYLFSPKGAQKNSPK